MTQDLSRRRLLTLLGSGLAISALPKPVLGAVAAGAGLQAANCRGYALGSEVTLTVLHQNFETAQNAGRAALAKLQRIDELMSVYRDRSEIATLNRDGRLARPHEYVVDVLRQAQEMSVRSGGAFDVTVQPLWKLFADGKSAGRMPDEAAIAATRARVDHRKLRVGDELVELAEKGMAITLNGIAQGFAADRVVEVLKSYGIEHALINTGEVAPMGANAQGKPWTAGIQHPRRDDAFVAIARLEGRSLATSGDYATTFTADRVYNHIFDPKSGISPKELSSVSIVAPTATLADALSTTVFVLGSDAGMKLLQQYQNVDALLVRKDGTQLATADFPRAS